MASTDIDGSTIVILTENEALQVYSRLIAMEQLTDVEQGLIHKIKCSLKIKKNEYRGHQYEALDSEGLSGGTSLYESTEEKDMDNFKSKLGTWRLSNEQMTIKVEVDSDNNIQSIASVAHRFVGQPLNNLARWMNNMSKIDIILLKKGNKE